MRILDIAENEKGYLEKSKKYYELYGNYCLYPKTDYAGDDNLTKYAVATGHAQGQAWCQTFIAFLMMQAYGKNKANELLCGKFDSPSTMEVTNAMVAAGREVKLYNAREGDLVYRSRSGGGHVGIVKGWKNGKIVSIEGNSSSSDITSWNGGAVVEHVGAEWQWCVRPAYPTEWHWVKADGYWYYQDENGNNKHGWVTIKESHGENTHWYYFNDVGQMLEGAQWVDGEYCCFMDKGDLEGALCKSDEKGYQHIWNV